MRYKSTLKGRPRHIAILAVIGGFVLTVPAFAQSYTAFDIGTLGGAGTYGTAINGNGQVIGNSNTVNGADHAFITQANGQGISDLGTLPGGNRSLSFAINASGQVVGDSEVAIPGFNMKNSGYFADINGMREINSNWTDSHARGINDAGQVVGNTVTGVFITGTNGTGVTEIGSLQRVGDTASDINTLGQVVGQAYPSFNYLYRHAYITSANHVFVSDLGTLGGKTSVASGINDSGQVVGTSETATSTLHAFITDINSNMTDLGTLGGASSTAFDINSSGQVVGWANTGVGGNTHAFITGLNGTGMIDINNLIHLPNGVFLADARGINDRGQILANASDGHAYLLSPVPEPEIYAMLLSGIGIMGFIARRRKIA